MEGGREAPGDDHFSRSPYPGKKQRMRHLPALQHGAQPAELYSMSGDSIRIHRFVIPGNKSVQKIKDQTAYLFNAF